MPDSKEAPAPSILSLFKRHKRGWAVQLAILIALILALVLLSRLPITSFIYSKF